MKTLELQAVDTLFFRDGKPFSMGEDTYAQGVFPPYPSVLFGLLNSIYVAGDLSRLNNVKNANQLISPLEIGGYLPVLTNNGSINGEPVFPVPGDLYANKDHERAGLLQCVSVPSSLISEYGYSYLLQSKETVKGDGAWGEALMNRINFEQWLGGTHEEFDILFMKDYYTNEPKIGIGRNFDTRISSEGMLYRLDMKRLHGKKGRLGFLVKYKGLELGNGVARMGAENKAVEYTEAIFPEIVTPVKETDPAFKIYLSTPAVFAEGQYPQSWFTENGLRLLAAAIGKPVAVGGFDIVARRPKEMRKAVPAGTVYYVQVADASKASHVVSKLHGHSIYSLAGADDSYKKQYGKQGFGLTYIGKLDL